MLLVPRDYQEFGISKVFEYFSESSNPGNPLLLYPTGTGKSIIVAGICTRALAWHPPTRIMMLTKTKELVEQNYQKLKLAWTEAPVGIYCDGLGKKQHHYPITFASIQSVFRIGELFGYIDFVIVDEAHEISPNEESMYRKFFAKLAERNPKLKIIGLTATGFRMKTGKLVGGEAPLFSDVIVDSTHLEAFNWYFEQGYLVPPIPRPTKMTYDPSKIAIRGGEYDEKQMQAEVDDQKKNESVVLELLEHGQFRHSGIVFGGGVDHVKNLWAIFEYYAPGSATWVASRGMGDKERDRNIAAFKDDQYKWIINNGILTTGFDKTNVDIMGIARLLLSPGLWVQILGRGTRPHYAPGFDLLTQAGRLASIAASCKQNCMCLDFGQNVTRLGPINDPRVPEPKERKRAGDAPIRICDVCGCYCHASARSCWNCGAEFARYLKIGESGTKALVVNSSVAPKVTIETKWRNVDRVAYAIHKKDGKPDSMRILYHCGRKVYSDFLFFEHEGFPGFKSREWWRKRSDEAPPKTTADAHSLALSGFLKVPRRIEVVSNQPNQEIKDYEF